jgi:hypothetical protein
MARPEIKTIQNLESAFAGESMAHIKYRYFAKLARALGFTLPCWYCYPSSCTRNCY